MTSMTFLAAGVVDVHAEADRPSRPFSLTGTTSEQGALEASIDLDAFQQVKSLIGPSSLEVPTPEGNYITLDLERFSVVAPDAVFLIGSATGDQPLERSEVVLLRGKIRGRQHSHAFLSLSPSGMINGFVDEGETRPYVLATTPANIKGDSRLLTVSPVSALGGMEVPFCGTKDELFQMPDFDKALESAPPLDAGPYLLRVAIDADQRFVQLFSNTTEARDYIVQLLGAISVIYERDNNIRLVLTYARLWPSGNEPFVPYDLSGFRSHWLSREDTTGLNLIHMFSGVRNTSYGGVAFYSNTCNGYGFGIDAFLNGSFASPVDYPDNGNWDLNVVAHEMGHNCGSPHTHSDAFSPRIDECGNGLYSRGTMMSYCHTNQGYQRNIDLRFHRRVQQVIANTVWLAGCHGRDCNGNNIDDAIDITEGVSLDVNADGIPDECQDCNGNSILDPDDITGGMPDVDGNGVPDECESDCNTNSVPDQHETWTELLPDEDGNNVPDECDPDCNGNDILDYIEINGNMALDLDRNRVLDTCQDCNGNSTPDWIDLGRPHNLYVCDQGYGQIREFQSQSGVLERTLWMPASASSLYDVIPGSDGLYLYVAHGDSGVIKMAVADGSTSILVALGSGNLQRPTALVLGSDGNLYVADADGHAVRMYDTANGTTLGDFISSGASPLSSPYALTFGPNGNLFVASSDNAVYEYNGTSGAYVGPFVTLGSGPLSQPRGLAFLSDGNLLVSSYGSGQILEYDSAAGSFVRVFNDEYPMSSPWGLRVGPNGNVFVAAIHESQARILEYIEDAGRYYRSFVRGSGFLNLPTGICFLPDSPDDINGNMIPDACEPGDLDGDGVADVEDNCPGDHNPLQTDGDEDGAGDACDNCLSLANTDQRDVDEDGYGDVCDNCPAVANSGQNDSDSDGRGDGCDNCQGLVNADQADADGDFIGDPCDSCPDDLSNDRDGDSLCAGEDNCPSVYNPDQIDINDNGYGDICEPETFDVVSTSCVQLAVSSRGNFGGSGSPGATMDYGYQDGCAWVYIYDGSPVIAYAVGETYHGYHSLHGGTSYQMLPGGDLPMGTADSVDYEVYHSGHFMTADSALALEKSWYAPKQSDSCNFVVQRLSVWSANGQAHEGLAIGELVDWDIPAEPNAVNIGGFDVSSKLVYQAGTGIGCIDNSHRYGGQALVGIQTDSPCIDTSAAPYGAFTESNAEYLYGGIEPDVLYNLMQVSGYDALGFAMDQFALLTYFDSLSLGVDDTVRIYTIVATVRDGTASDLTAAISKGKQWAADHVLSTCYPGCCTGPTMGNVDCQGINDIGDVTVMIQKLFITLEDFCCEDEADLDRSGLIDIGDLTILIQSLFITLLPLGPCP